MLCINMAAISMVQLNILQPPYENSLHTKCIYSLCIGKGLPRAHYNTWSSVQPEIGLISHYMNICLSVCNFFKEGVQNSGSGKGQIRV